MSAMVDAFSWVQAAGVTVAAALLAAALVHVYWALGGKLAILAAIPERDGRAIFRPRAWPTAAVAVALAACAFLALLVSGWLAPNWLATHVPRWLIVVPAWAVALVFALRAVGDFRYVGFAKRIRGSRFARLDDFCYAPLCACIAMALGFVLLAGHAAGALPAF